MYNSIPEWLKVYPIFCTHKDKIPDAHVDDINTFKSFEDTIISLQPGEGLGVGLFGNLCGIDIDHAVNDDGTLSQTTQDIINYFDGAYIEYSLSGTGVHILFFCSQQRKYQKYYTKMGVKQLIQKGISDIEGLELYQGSIDNRYFTLTGNAISTEYINYTVSPKKLEAFLDKYFKKPLSSPTTPPPLTHNDAEDLAWWNWARLRKPERLFSLASKMPTGSGGTESEDDLAFMAEIAFHVNKNPRLMKDVFEASSYYKNKDDKHKRKWARKDYQDTTISKAQASGVTAKEFFKDSFYYDESLNAIVPIPDDERSDYMIAPKITTRTSQSGNTVAVINTRTFKFEAAMPQQKKNSNERTVKWVSVYEKGSDKPSSFLNRTDPAFELAAGIVLEKF